MSRRQRSAVTNGKLAFLNGDGSSPWARRQRDLVALHASDLGGSTRMSEAQLSLCRRAATLETQCELMEGKLSLGKSIDLDLYNRLVGSLRRVFETIGLERIAVDVGPPTILFSPPSSAVEAPRSCTFPRAGTADPQTGPPVTPGATPWLRLSSRY